MLAANWDAPQRKKRMPKASLVGRAFMDLSKISDEALDNLACILGTEQQRRSSVARAREYVANLREIEKMRA
jgi:hypothetical protein